MTEPIYQRVMNDLDRRFTHPSYHDPDTTPPEAPVSLLDDIRAEITRAVTWTEDEFRAALPTAARAADYADAVASSAPAKAILDAVLSPADEAWIVGLVQRLDQRVHGAETAGENLHAGAEVPDPGEPQPAPAGPQVGGQA